MMRVPPLAGPIDEVDLVALLEKLRNPAPAPVRRADPVGSLPVAAVNEHDRERVPHRRGIQCSTYICDPLMIVAASQRRLLDAVPVVAPVGDVQHGPRAAGGNGRRLRAQGGRQESAPTVSAARAPLSSTPNSRREYVTASP